jgi:hypothetical protein
VGHGHVVEQQHVSLLSGKGDLFVAVGLADLVEGGVLDGGAVAAGPAPASLLSPSSGSSPARRLYWRQGRPDYPDVVERLAYEMLAEKKGL